VNCFALPTQEVFRRLVVESGNIPPLLSGSEIWKWTFLFLFLKSSTLLQAGGLRQPAVRWATGLSKWLNDPVISHGTDRAKDTYHTASDRTYVNVLDSSIH